MRASVTNDKDAPLPGRIRQALQIRNEFPRAGNVQLPAGEHEIRLRIHVPENHRPRNHAALPL